jgi:hypothetical protein
MLRSPRRSFSPWPLVSGICIGILLAFPLAAPLMGGKILEPVATLWGNALGAVGAIAAAIWAADRASNLQRRQGASLILMFVGPVARELEKLTAFYKNVAPIQDDELQPHNVLDHATAKILLELCHPVSDAYRKFGKSGARIEGVLNFLGPHEMDIFFGLEAELETMSYVVGGLTHHAATSENQSLGHTPSTGLRTRLIKTTSQIRQYVSALEKAAR